MDTITIVTQPITRDDLRAMAQRGFGEFVKAVVDISQGVMALNGELHADEEHVLLEKGSQQQDLWGVNVYPDSGGDEWIEFDSMINIRPSQGNRSRSVESKEVQEKIRRIISELVKD